MTHLEALQLRLSHERNRLNNAKSPAERELRSVWVAGIEKEIAHEIAFRGKREAPESYMSDDELLAALMA